MHLCVSHLVVVVIFMIFILLTFLLSPHCQSTAPPLPPLPDCTLLVVLSHSFYVLFSATLLLCHFTFVTLPSPHPLPLSLFIPLSSCLSPYPFYTLCVASLWRCPRSYFMCFHLPRTTDAHWLHTQDCPSPSPTALSSLPPPPLSTSVRLLITYRLDSHCQF